MKLITTFAYRPTLQEQKQQIKDVSYPKTERISSAAHLPKVDVQKAWPFPTDKSSSLYDIALCQDVRIVHCMGEQGYGGVTMAYRKTSDFAGSNMVEVAVAYCSKYDVFAKKVGTRQALKNWFDKKRVLVPARSNNDDYSIPANLREMFWYSLNV